MKKTLLLTIAIFALSVVSCLNEETLQQQSKTLTFTASIDPTLTKTTVDADPKSATAGIVSWELADSVTIQDNSNNTAVYIVSEIINGGKAIFEYKSGAALGEGPYTATYGSAPLINQVYSEIPGKLPMTAVSETNVLSFGVTCGLLKIMLTSAGESIRRIAVTGTPTGGEETTYLLTCADAQSIETEKAFYIMLPPGSYTRYVFYDSEGRICTKNAKEGYSTVIVANGIQQITFSSSLAFDYKHEYVDLGLSVKWATTDVDAGYPEECGGLYGWGEIETKASYTWDYYKWHYKYYDSPARGSIHSFKKYVTNGYDEYWEDGHGEYHSDSKTILDEEDDVVYQKWGYLWHIPTSDQWQELIDNCTWTQTSLNGVEGYLVTSKKAGYTDNSIFLPGGSYWSKMLQVDDPQRAWCVQEMSLLPQERYRALHIRPVTSVADMNLSSSANCYIVSSEGEYKFKTVKGNSNESVGDVKGVKVLWESYGTDAAPSMGALVNTVIYSDGYISFKATAQKGNAVIAAYSDADCTDGNVLWSWHIWMTDAPSEQSYANNAGIMMDRNLGATSATPGDVKSLGLLYQWGRKDPFLGASSIDGSATAASTITWPAEVLSNSENGTISFAVKYPTTYISSTSEDWYYTGSTMAQTDNTRWQSDKGLYDPCPSGWRVPDGDVWATALGTSAEFKAPASWSNNNIGMDFGSFPPLGSGYSSIWYPAAYFIANESLGIYWSCTPESNNVYSFMFQKDGTVEPKYSFIRYVKSSVRCCKITQ